MNNQLNEWMIASGAQEGGKWGEERRRRRGEGKRNPFGLKFSRAAPTMIKCRLTLRWLLLFPLRVKCDGRYLVKLPPPLPSLPPPASLNPSIPLYRNWYYWDEIVKEALRDKRNVQSLHFQIGASHTDRSRRYSIAFNYFKGRPGGGGRV